MSPFQGPQKPIIANFTALQRRTLAFLPVRQNQLNDLAAKLASFSMDPKQYELFPDVPQLLDMIKSDLWPWTETIMACFLRNSISITDSLDGDILRHLGLPVLESVPSDNLVNTPSIIGLPIHKVPGQDSAGIFDIFRQMLGISHTENHHQIEHVYVSGRVSSTGLSLASAYKAKFPGVYSSGISL